MVRSRVKLCAICNTNIPKIRRKYCSEKCRLESKCIIAKKWNKENKAAHLKHQHKFIAKNPIVFKEKERESYLKNREHRIDQSLKWAKRNPGKCNANKVKRKAAKLYRTPKWLTENDWKWINWMYFQARKLTELTKIKYEVDHIIPLQGAHVSGLHAPLNLQILTKSENCRKGNR